MWVFLNDQFVPEEEACISVFDQGFLYGDGVFETMRVHDRRVKFLDASQLVVDIYIRYM